MNDCLDCGNRRGNKCVCKLRCFYHNKWVPGSILYIWDEVVL